MLHKVLFPQLDLRHWGYLNLGEESRNPEAHKAIATSLIAKSAPANPFLSTEYFSVWLDELHTSHAIKYSYGGWMEDRNHLWRGHYMKPGHAWHLGVDYNVPAGTEVYMPFEAALCRGEIDPDQNGGWGGKLVFYRHVNNTYYIFGHLDDTIHLQSGARAIRPRVNAGTLLGRIGAPPMNGNWHPHLHVQALSRKNKMIMSEVDGYLPLYKGIDEDFPRPDFHDDSPVKFKDPLRVKCICRLTANDIPPGMDSDDLILPCEDDPDCPKKAK